MVWYIRVSEPILDLLSVTYQHYYEITDLTCFLRFPPPSASPLANMEWSKQTYNQQYEKWVPWMEDVYLRWFTKDNKTSYTAKRTFRSRS